MEGFLRGQFSFRVTLQITDLGWLLGDPWPDLDILFPSSLPCVGTGWGGGVVSEGGSTKEATGGPPGWLLFLPPGLAEAGLTSIPRHLGDSSLVQPP